MQNSFFSCPKEIWLLLGSFLDDWDWIALSCTNSFFRRIGVLGLEQREQKMRKFTPEQWESYCLTKPAPILLRRTLNLTIVQKLSPIACHALLLSGFPKDLLLSYFEVFFHYPACLNLLVNLDCETKENFLFACEDIFSSLLFYYFSRRNYFTQRKIVALLRIFVFLGGREKYHQCLTTFRSSHPDICQESSSNLIKMVDRWCNWYSIS